MKTKESIKNERPASMAIIASARGIAQGLHQNDERSVDTLYQHVLVAARSLNVFKRGKVYSNMEVYLIQREVNRLFPQRGEY